MQHRRHLTVVLGVAAAAVIARYRRDMRALDAQADAYATLLDGIGIRRAAVQAISGGAPSAIRFAVRHPGCAEELRRTDARLLNFETLPIRSWGSSRRISAAA
jgi:pimeloyl-ACP methyl ester carboxylesterase